MFAGDHAGSRRKRVLVTGALGHVARHVTPMLTRQYDLMLTDLAPDGPGQANGHIRYADLRRWNDVPPLMSNIDAVLHLAIASPAKVNRLSPSERDDEVMAVNVMGAQHVLEAARLAGVPKVVFMSSMTTMLGEPRRTRFSEQMPPQPNGLYACTKLFGEWLGECYARQHGMRVICIRLGQPYPYGYEGEQQELADPWYRGMKVSHDDIALAVTCALEDQTQNYRVISVTSASDCDLVDLSSAAAIGYRPGTWFSATGSQPIKGVVPAPVRSQSTP